MPWKHGENIHTVGNKSALKVVGMRVTQTILKFVWITALLLIGILAPRFTHLWMGKFTSDSVLLTGSALTATGASHSGSGGKLGSTEQLVHFLFASQLKLVSTQTNAQSSLPSQLLFLKGMKQECNQYKNTGNSTHTHTQKIVKSVKSFIYD